MVTVDSGQHNPHLTVAVVAEQVVAQAVAFVAAKVAAQIVADSPAVVVAAVVPVAGGSSDQIGSQAGPEELVAFVELPYPRVERAGLPPSWEEEPDPAAWRHQLQTHKPVEHMLSSFFVDPGELADHAPCLWGCGGRRNQRAGRGVEEKIKSEKGAKRRNQKLGEAQSRLASEQHECMY